MLIYCSKCNKKRNFAKLGMDRAMKKFSAENIDDLRTKYICRTCGKIAKACKPKEEVKTA